MSKEDSQPSITTNIANDVSNFLQPTNATVHGDQSPSASIAMGALFESAGAIGATTFQLVMEIGLDVHATYSNNFNQSASSLTNHNLNNNSQVSPFPGPPAPSPTASLASQLARKESNTNLSLKNANQAAEPSPTVTGANVSKPQPSVTI